MNLSEQYSSIGSENDCTSLFAESVPLQYPSTSLSYHLLVAAAVLEFAACPITIILNALVMVAVKTKRRLQTHPNILLACLALTDLMAGLVAQPLHITKTIFLLQDRDFQEFCDLDLAFTVSFAIFNSASMFHLVIASGERYLAIKHPFTYASVVTKIRVLFSSALAWIAANLHILIALHSMVVIFPLVVTTFTLIIVFQILVYKEARRHEKHILSHQVSDEARARFLQEKKALKLTTIILVTIFLCFFFPSSFTFVVWYFFSKKFSPDAKTLIRHISVVACLINSALNPVIYTVKKRQFRVVFIELLLRKNLQEAEEFQLRLFASRPNAVGQQNGQEGEGQEQNGENENEIHPNDNHEDKHEILVHHSANFDDNKTTATENVPVSTNACNSTSKEKKVQHAWGRENPALQHDKTTEGDNPAVRVIGGSLVDLEKGVVKSENPNENLQP